MLSTSLKWAVPEFIDFLNIIVRMGAILEAISFRILAGMLSGTWTLFGFNSFSNFSVPLTVIWIRGICGDRVWFLGKFMLVYNNNMLCVLSMREGFVVRESSRMFLPLLGSRTAW